MKRAAKKDADGAPKAKKIATISKAMDLANSLDAQQKGRKRTISPAKQTITPLPDGKSKDLRTSTALPALEETHQQAKRRDQKEGVPEKDDTPHAKSHQPLYKQNMNDIVTRFNMPGYPGFVIQPALEVNHDLNWNCTNDLEMTFRLTDYYTEPIHTARLESQWIELRTWLIRLGFKHIYFDHGAKQHLHSCGVVAARVSIYLKAAGNEFYECDTTQAASLADLHEGNIALMANDVPLDYPWETSAKFTSETESMHVADAFNDGPSMLTAGPQNEPSRFLTWEPFDYFLKNLAKDLNTARNGGTVPRRYKIVNNQDSRCSGEHWVSVVYEMKPPIQTNPFKP